MKSLFCGLGFGDNSSVREKLTTKSSSTLQKTRYNGGQGGLHKLPRLARFNPGAALRDCVVRRTQNAPRALERVAKAHHWKTRGQQCKRLCHPKYRRLPPAPADFWSRRYLSRC